MEEDFNFHENKNLQDNEQREFENALRPLSFSGFSGQSKVVENLKIFVIITSAFMGFKDSLRDWDNHISN